MFAKKGGVATAVSGMAKWALTVEIPHLREKLLDESGQPLISSFVRRQMMDRYYPNWQKKKQGAPAGAPVTTSPLPQEAGGPLPQPQSR